MSKRNGPIDQLWNGALLILGATIAIWLSLQVLAEIWGWLLLIAAIIGVLAGGLAALRWWWNRRSSRW
jgi:hypothetical protein